MLNGSARMIVDSSSLVEFNRKGLPMLSMLAALDVSAGGVIAWLVVGLVAGWLAGVVMKGSGYGIVGDIIVGLIGSLIGGFVVGLFFSGTTGFWGSIVVAFIGACLLIAVVRLIRGSGRIGS
jgi:uncharacterized membrane protein YeaQ/YmgE (transglycosylase-associated protein family)